MWLPLLATAAVAAASEPDTIVLSDGQELRGEATKLPDGSWEVVLADGKRLVLAADAVRKVREGDAAGDDHDPSAWERDPNRTRYFYGPTAYTLGHLNGYVSQKELLLTTVAVGISDYWDLQVGTVLPTLFVQDARIAVAGTKVAVPLHPKLRVGAGVQAFFVSGGAVGLLFGNATWGSASRNVTVAGGAGVNFADLGGSATPIVSVSGVYRLGPQAGLVTENWLLLGGDVVDSSSGGPFFLIPSGGVRLYGRRFSVDLGLVVFEVPPDPGSAALPLIPIPWVDFTWSWSLAPKKEGGGASSAPPPP